LELASNNPKLCKQIKKQHSSSSSKEQTVGALGSTDVNPKNLDGPEVET
jgi:hypothetical protein